MSERKSLVLIADDEANNPRCSVSIGIVDSSERPIESHWEASEIATEMKQVAKRQQGSSYAVDRRREPAGKPATRAPAEPEPPAKT